MQNLRAFRLSAMLVCGLLAASAQDRTVAILFGPHPAADRAKASARTTLLAGEWLAAPGTTLQLRRPGVRDSQELMKFMKPDEIERAVADAARVGGEAAPGQLFDSLEMAAYALARSAGTRFLVLALEGPELSPDQTGRLQQITEQFQANKVRVLIWDCCGTGARAWTTLATATGGARESDLAKLAAIIQSAAPASVPARQIDTEPKVLSHLHRAAPPSAAGAGATVGVFNGDFITEVPMSLLQFDTQGSNATARVRVTQTIKNKAGVQVWQARKELTVKSPAARLDARKTGLLAYVRQVRLTAGEYNLVSEVEDLNAGKALTGASPATATDMIPGLTLSGALIVRPLNKQNDLMEGDDIIQYDGKALMPILAPTFVAQEPFTLSVYFIMYPELRGSGPRVRLQLLQDGRPAGGGSVGFSDKIADESRDLSGSSAGEQKHAFPYLSHLAGAVLPAGSYEVKVVVQQDTQEMTRTVPFRVVKK